MVDIYEKNILVYSIVLEKLITDIQIHLNNILYSLLLEQRSKNVIDGIIYINLEHRNDRNISILKQLDNFFMLNQLD
jgi:hypothetical protein